MGTKPVYTLDGQPVDVEEFIADNAEMFTEVDVEEIRALEPGEWVTFGGGAGCAFTLRREARQ